MYTCACECGKDINFYVMRPAPQMRVEHMDQTVTYYEVLPNSDAIVQAATVLLLISNQFESWAWKGKGHRLLWKM